jgi:hypothetical protein
MKTLRLIPLMVIVVILALIANRQLTAQPSKSSEDRGSLGDYEQLVIALSKSGQTNLVTEITKLVTHMHAEQKAIDISMSVAILSSLRAGHTNEAISLLETKLDGALIGFDTLPHEPGVQKVVERARKYREQFPHKTGKTAIDEGVARTLNSVSQ